MFPRTSYALTLGICLPVVVAAAVAGLAGRRRSFNATAHAGRSAVSRIEGTVKEVNGSAISRARVCAIDFGVIAASSHNTCVDGDRDGRYQLVLAPGKYLVSAGHEGFEAAAARSGHPVDSPEGGSSGGFDIALQPGGAVVAGRVLDALHRAVRAVVRGERTIEPRVTLDVQTDDEGRFAISLPAGPVMLKAQAADYAVGRWVGVAPSTNVRFALIPGARARGIVVSSTDRRPVAGIEVRAAPSGNPLSPRWVSSTTDDEGSFDLGGIEPGSYSLVATTDGLRGTAGPVEIGLGGAVDGLRIELSPAASISGRVVLADRSRPCDEGVVSLGLPDPKHPAPNEDSATLPLTSLTFVADIGLNGDVRFPAVAPGRYFVSVRCAQHVLRAGPQVLDISTAPLTGLVWTVVAGASLTVVTVDEHDQPIPDVPFLLRFPRWSEARPSALAPDRTDEAGHRDFGSELSPGAYEVNAHPPFDAQPIRVDLREGAGPVVAKLVLADSGSIVARVHDAEGGVDGLSVTAVPKPNDGGSDARMGSVGVPRGPAAHYATDLGTGRYRIGPLKAGSYEVRVDDGVNATLRASYDVDAGEVRSADFEITRDGRIHGHVLGSDNEPLAGVSVTVSSADRPANPSLLSPDVLERRAPALTGAAGEFLIDRLAGGSAAYDLRAERSDGSATVKRGVATSDDVVVWLRDPGRISGTVEGECATSQAPVLVQATNAESGQSLSLRLAHAGEPFSFRIASGGIQLTAICKGGGFARTSVALAPKTDHAGIRLVLESPRIEGGAQSSSLSASNRASD